MRVAGTIIYQDYPGKNRLKSVLAHGVLSRACAAIVEGFVQFITQPARKLSVGEFLRALVNEAAQQEAHRRNRLDADEWKIAEDEGGIAEG
jgi:hypothetical protein